MLHKDPILDDDGSATINPYKDLQRALYFAKHERHYVAADLYLSVKERIKKWEVNGRSSIKITSNHEITGAVANGTQATNVNNAENINLTKSGLSPSKKKLPRPVANLLRITKNKGTRDDDNIQLFQKARAFLEENQEDFDEILELAETFKDAERNLLDDKDYIFSNKRREITTSYRHEADNTLTVRLEGILEGISIFEEIAVLRETDLYHYWAPFCVKSKQFARFGFSDSLSWLETEIPLIHLTREALYRGKGCDCINERGLIILVCQGIDDKKNSHSHNSFFSTSSLTNIPDKIELPPKPSGRIGARLELRCLHASIEVLSMKSIRTRIVINFDPNIDYLPQWLFEFGMKNMAGYLLIALQRAARNAIENPNDSPHAKRIREDKEFYKDFLVPRFEAYCSKMQLEMLPIPSYDTGDKDENDCGKSSASFPLSVSSKKVTQLDKLMNRTRRKEEEMKIKIELERKEMDEFLKPTDFNEKQMERLTTLKNSRNMEDQVPQQQLMKQDRSSEIFPLFYLILSFILMMMVVHGISRSYFEILVVEGPNNIMFLGKIFRTIILLSFNGVFHVVVLRTSLLVTFDAVEHSTASYRRLHNTKKRFSERIVLILIVFITAVIFFSLFRALSLYYMGGLLTAIRECTIYFFTQITRESGTITSDIIKEAPHNQWQRLAIDTANFWMSQTSLFFVILTIGFSVMYTSPISKAETNNSKPIESKSNATPVVVDTTLINRNNLNVSQNMATGNIIKDTSENALHATSSNLSNDFDLKGKKKKKYNGLKRKKKQLKDDETDHTASGISISSVHIPHGHNQSNFDILKRVSEVSLS